ncbi:MAG: DUF4167 domain-containing protein [Alphaproteobacteria bacterium]|jgi:hypothetical protein|nr:DUF4167 domain-containing protein [Alphaproteobacteria bacterium]MBN9567133.1 DUF4167 domain-containing protein [Alphaproteobacteria bacterium]MBN9569662.1 DUF4167 domain-containing protein [Alphaproteobacteria bacterium]MBN9592128.1 DUF4167 domain-containing protein [Alphaproteobacteria bacterium]
MRVPVRGLLFVSRHAGVSNRQGDHVKRSRRGGRRPQTNHGGNHNNYNPNRTYDSNGPEVKIRGSASHVYEKYLQLARDANASGDRVMAENYLQHAEHYFRILAVIAAQQAQYQQANGQAAAAAGNGNGARPADGTVQNGASGATFSIAEGSEPAEEPAEVAGETA